jgi:hypothetical protein
LRRSLRQALSRYNYSYDPHRKGIEVRSIKAGKPFQGKIRLEAGPGRGFGPAAVKHLSSQSSAIMVKIVAFLMSPEGEMIDGQVVMADG